MKELGLEGGVKGMPQKNLFSVSEASFRIDERERMRRFMNPWKMPLLKTKEMGMLLIKTLILIEYLERISLPDIPSCLFPGKSENGFQA